MSIVWRASWINEYETPWSIFEKIVCKNLVTRNEILRGMGSEEIRKIKTFVLGDAKRELITLRGFDQDILKGELDYDLHVHNKSVIKKILGPVHHYKVNIQTWFPDQLKWCAECLEMGYHSWLHQFSMVDKCPFHEIELRTTCPNCHIKLPFLISDTALGHPFTCKCGYQHADISHSTDTDDWDLKLEIRNDAMIKWPYAFAYVNWKKFIEGHTHTRQVDNKYRPSRERSKYEMEFLSKQDDSALWDIVTKWEYGKPYWKYKHLTATIWIINRVFAHFALNHFYSWLEIAKNTESLNLEFDNVPFRYENVPFFLIKLPHDNEKELEFHWWLKDHDQNKPRLVCPFKTGFG